tara:strand:+ start:213 stop:1229 length:1017 start_codon:yes stop_codon:yes gene_type:complete
MFDKVEPFVIAEVGQNHQGNLDKAREYIKVFSFAGANAIKFQTRNNRYLFSNDAYHANYSSENSFAKTYGEHREKLELSIEALKILKSDCEKYGVKFMSTAFDEPSLEILRKIDVDIIKIASFDLGNLPFLNRIKELSKPVVLSIGGGKSEEIKKSVDILKTKVQCLAILHCVSEYPCKYNRLGLENIRTLIKEFPDCTIGSSDHFNGILSGPVAYMMGARVFEKHVTLNRSWKGTDHSFALEPEGFRKFARDIKRVNYMLPKKDDSELGNEPVFKKLGKSLTAFKDIEIGEIFTLDNLSGKIFNSTYIPVRRSHTIIGKKARRNIKKDEAIRMDDVE